MKLFMNIVAVVLVFVFWSGVGAAAQQVPCYFIFGDSLVDNGNNNRLTSLAKANYAPYGIDFPHGPTGRFSNGKTTADVIAELLGFDSFIPPYATARGRDILKGVNYASAAAGIREETGRQLGQRISFRGQVQNYQRTVSQVVNLLGDEKTAANYLSKCIYSIGLGSNDYLNNYFMPAIYSSSRQYTPQQYANVLLQAYAQQIRDQLGSFEFDSCSGQIRFCITMEHGKCHYLGLVKLVAAQMRWPKIAQMVEHVWKESIQQINYSMTD